MTQRDRRLLYVIVPGSVLLVWRGIALVGRLTPASATAATPAAEAPASPPAAEALIPRATRGERITYSDDPRVLEQLKGMPSTWSRDPFYSPRLANGSRAEAPVSADKPPAAPAWQLVGISSCDGRATALLGGRIVSSGTMLEDNYKVLEITDDSVLLLRNGWEYRYRLGTPNPETRRERRLP